MEVIIFILCICIFVLFNNFYSLKRESQFLRSILERNSTENEAIKKELDALKKAVSGESPSVEFKTPPTEEIKTAPIPEEETKPYFTPIEVVASSAETVAEENILSDAKDNATVEQDLPILNYESHPLPRYSKAEEKEEEEKVYTESAFTVFIKKAEKQFADNWTGILGTGIMVLGIGYLSIYTALKVSPLFRILILWGYAGLLIGSYYILKKKEKWERTGLWLRSAGASLFLFGCFGASQIPALTFIANPIAGYSLITLGIALNLYVGYIIKKQTFLSLHVVLSMLILCVIPDKLLITFLLAAVTAAIGIVLSYKEKWEYHLLIVIVAFIIFDIWFNAGGASLTATENIFAIIGIIAVAASCMVMQYRSVYENTHFDKAAFITHLTNWILFATGLILHSTGSHFKTVVLFVGAVICFFIALKARKKKVYWLYHLDGMVAFVLCSLSIVMLNDWNIGVDIIACLLYSSTLACLFVVYREKERLLHNIFLGINHIMTVGLIYFLVLLVTDSIVATRVTSAIVSIAVLALMSVAVPVFSAIKKDSGLVDSFIGEKKLSLNGLASIAFFVFLFVASNQRLDNNAFYYVVLATAFFWCYLRKQFQANTFDLGRLFFLGTAILLGILLITSKEKNYTDWTFAIGLFSVILFNWTVKRFYSNEFIIRFIGIIGTNALLLAFSSKYLIGQETAMIFTLFGIALLNHEFLWINFKKNILDKHNQKLLYVAYFIFAVLGSLRFVFNTHHLSNTTIGLICLGISSIEIYVLFAKSIHTDSTKTIPDWSRFNLFNSELLLFNSIVFGFSCLQFEFTAVFFSGIAVVSFFGFLKFAELIRFNNYSFLLLIGSIFLTIYSAMNGIDLANKNTLYITETLTVLLSVIYVALQFTGKDDKGKRYLLALPYIQNAWIIVLLFIQTEFRYLPLLLMVLALVNFGLMIVNKIKINFYTPTIIGLLAAILSVAYSFDKLNHFNVIDWVLQLGSVALGLLLVILITKKEAKEAMKSNYQIVLNIWLSVIMFSQLEHKWLPVYWAAAAILNLFLYHKKISREKNISLLYYLLANVHLGFVSFNYYESKFLAVYLLIFVLLGVYIYLAYKWMEEFELKNSLLVYPATLSIGCFLYLTFDKGVLTFFWILEALGLLILGILLKEKYFRYVSLSLVGLCVVRLMFFDLSNADFLIRALVLLGVGVVLLVMNSLFKKYKDRFD